MLETNVVIADVIYYSIEVQQILSTRYCAIILQSHIKLKDIFIPQYNSKVIHFNSSLILITKIT